MEICALLNVGILEYVFECPSKVKIRVFPKIHFKDNSLMSFAFILETVHGMITFFIQSVTVTDVIFSNNICVLPG